MTLMAATSADVNPALTTNWANFAGEQRTAFVGQRELKIFHAALIE
jgi:hypothetical protein